MPGTGPEDTLVLDNRIYTGLDDGRVLRLTPDGRRIDVVADTSGRPLGLEAHPDGRIVVCDAQRGLLLLDHSTGAIQTLVPRGTADLHVCNNAGMPPTARSTSSTSTQRPADALTADLLNSSGTGRPAAADPDGEVVVIAEGLQFANGVALAPDESFVVVAQTGSYELTRVWLSGPDAGRTETFGDILPAFPTTRPVVPTA
ncbi:MAG: SMP-30/gluconolactonase/LRE family protein [Candidatus Nanopelagicales bacterium]